MVLIDLISVVVIIAAIYGAFWLVSAIAQRFNLSSRTLRQELRDSQERARVEHKRAEIACKGLRAVAAGSDSPVLEAQIALNEIENTYTKELN